MEWAFLVLGVALALLILVGVVGGSLWLGRRRWTRAVEMLGAAACALVAGGVPLILLLPALGCGALLFALVIWPSLTFQEQGGWLRYVDTQPFWVGAGLLVTLAAALIWHLPLLLSVALVGLRGARLPLLCALGTLLLGAFWVPTLPLWLVYIIELQEPYELVFLLGALPYGIALLALVGQVALMSLPVREPAPI